MFFGKHYRSSALFDTVKNARSSLFAHRYTTMNPDDDTTAAAAQ